MNVTRLKNRITWVLAIILSVGMAVLAFIATYRFVGSVEVAEDIPYDIFHVLISFASLSLIFLSVVIAIVAVFGAREIKNVIERKVQSELDEASDRFRGGIKLSTGVMYGQLARAHGEDRIDHEGPPPLKAAIELTDTAHQLLADAGTDEDRIKVVNNLAFYYVLDGNPGFGSKAIKLAREIRAHPEFGHDPDYIETYCLTVAKYWSFANDSKRMLDLALKKARALKERGDLDGRQMRNAHRTLVRVQRAWRERERREACG